MSKSRKGRKQQSTHQAAKKPRMTKEKIVEVKTWLERIRDNVVRAISLSKRMSLAGMNESNDLFWSLAKYAENVEESIVQLDNISGQIYPSLIKLDEDTWQNLKDMRSRLAHAFWNIEPRILWSTVTVDFPDLWALLSTMIVIDDPKGDRESIEFTLKTEDLAQLPDITLNSVEAGSRMVVVALGHSGKVRVVRIGHDSGDKLLVSANYNGRFSLWGRKEST